MRTKVGLTLLALSLGVPACTVAEPETVEGPQLSPGPVVAAAPPLDAGFRRAVDRTTGVKLPLPAVGYHLRGDHYPANLPPQKWTDRVTVVGPEGPVLEVHVWRNVEGQRLDDWFDRHLGSLPLATLTRGSATRHGVPALLLDLPRSPQAARQRVAVFALGDRVYRLVCLDGDAPRDAQLFERAVAGFAVEGTP